MISSAMYNSMMEALKEQRAEVMASREAAMKFITDYGLLEIWKAAPKYLSPQERKIRKGYLKRNSLYSLNEVY